MRRRRRLRGERGVTVVEAAIALPLLFMFALAVFDVGLWVFQTTQLSAGARDGARVGILNYRTADGMATQSSSPAPGTGLQEINSAVKARLPRQPYALTVTCVGAADETARSCATALPERDRIKVVVTYTRSPLTPVTAPFGAREIRGTAVMQLVGIPA